MPNFTQTISNPSPTGVCSLSINYTGVTPPPHTPSDGTVTSIVATNTGAKGTTVFIWTKAQGSDTNAVQQADGSWLHTISAPSGTITLGPGTANQTQFGWWGVTNDSDIVGMQVIPPA